MTSPRQPTGQHQVTGGLDIHRLLQTMVEKGASDLHLNPGRPPVVRVSGALVSTESKVLDDQTTETICREMTALAKGTSATI